MTTAAKPKAGLEDIVAHASAIFYLDGDRGVLAYCGYDIHDLARHATFEEVCFLLWHRRLPTRAQLGGLPSPPGALRPPPGGGAPPVGAPAGGGDSSPQANYRKAVRLTAQLASLVATMGRVNAGAGPIEPDPVLGHAANF